MGGLGGGPAGALRQRGGGPGNPVGWSGNPAPPRVPGKEAILLRSTRARAVLFRLRRGTPPPRRGGGTRPPRAPLASDAPAVTSLLLHLAALLHAGRLRQ
eukprot:1102157-Pyramimonas_sp.AAC.1